MNLIDIVAAAIFALCWVGYEYVLKRLADGRGGINIDMAAVRAGWIRRMLQRDVRIMDANLLGQLLSSASFFASTNLLIIAAASGVLFGGEDMIANLRGLLIASSAPIWLVETKIALIVVTLARGLLDFIWSIRQLNYCSALVGAAPPFDEPDKHDAFARAMTDVFDPAFSAFNKGMRTYYFALAATAWIISPWAMMLGVVAACALLLRRQVASSAAKGIRAARLLMQADEK
jgi:uncharacterized membrane protein